MYIKRTCYGGIDYHDIQMTITQVKWNGQYDIPETKFVDCIVKDILEDFPYLETQDVYTAVLKKQSFTFPFLYLENDKVVYPERYGEIWNSFGVICGWSLKEDYACGIHYETSYETENIPTDQLCYIAEEHFYAYTKGVPLIERFYHVPFWSLDEAKAYLKAMKKHNSESKLSIQVYNWKKISSTGWFQANMKAIELSSGDTEKGYSAFVDSHIENLQKLCGSDAEVNA